jgi:NAD(P)-dependent dehydrogenase (short-subunit alcohol dehydrogenase family)
MGTIRFENKIAIVTGAGAGIGREYAIALAKRGAKVVVNDLGSARDGSMSDAAPADRVVEEIRNTGGEAIANYDSVVTMAGGKNIITTAIDTYGTVDILINNAGILRDRTFLKMSEEDWDKVIGVHLKGAFCVTQPALKIMKAKNYGRIVFTSSTSGLYGIFGQTNYSAAKMGLVGLMNTLKLEMARYNIRVNTVAPNARTRLTEDFFDENSKKIMRTELNVPIVLYLCSEENPVSGRIYIMGAGWYGRAAVMTGGGFSFKDSGHNITVEEIRDHFVQINDLNQAEPHENASALLEDIFL